MSIVLLLFCGWGQYYPIRVNFWALRSVLPGTWAIYLGRFIYQLVFFLGPRLFSRLFWDSSYRVVDLVCVLSTVKGGLILAEELDINAMFEGRGGKRKLLKLE